MAKLTTPATAGFNGGRDVNSRPLRVADVVIDPEISGIFAVSDKTLAEIRERMKKFGYDKSQPIVVQKGTNVLVDGHTRLAAAKAAGLQEVPAYERDFDGRDEMLMYTFERQAVRRNLTGAEILTAARMIRGRKEADGKGRAAELLAEKLGCGVATVYQARAVLKEGSEEEIEAVRKGEKSIRAAYNDVKRKEGNEEDGPSPTAPWRKLESALTDVGVKSDLVGRVLDFVRDVLSACGEEQTGTENAIRAGEEV